MQVQKAVESMGKASKKQSKIDTASNWWGRQVRRTEIMS